jgi:hypothetical protein
MSVCVCLKNFFFLNFVKFLSLFLKSLNNSLKSSQDSSTRMQLISASGCSADKATSKSSSHGHKMNVDSTTAVKIGRSNKKKSNRVIRLLGHNRKQSAFGYNKVTSEIWIDGPMNRFAENPNKNEVWIDGPQSLAPNTGLAIGMNAMKQHRQVHTFGHMKLNVVDNSDYEPCTVVCDMPPITIVKPYAEHKATHDDTYDSLGDVDGEAWAMFNKRETEQLDIRAANNVDPNSQSSISLLSMDSHVDIKCEPIVGKWSTMNDDDDESSGIESCSELYSKTSRQTSNNKDLPMRSESHSKLLTEDDDQPPVAFNYNTLPNLRVASNDAPSLSLGPKSPQSLDYKQKLDDLKHGFDKMIFKQSYKDIESLHKTLESILNLTSALDSNTVQTRVQLASSNRHTKFEIGVNQDDANIYDVIPLTLNMADNRAPHQATTRLGSDSSDQYCEPYDFIATDANPVQVMVVNSNKKIPAIQQDRHVLKHVEGTMAAPMSVINSDMPDSSQRVISSSVPAIPKTNHVPLNQRLHNSLKMFRFPTTTTTKNKEGGLLQAVTSKQGDPIISRQQMSTKSKANKKPMRTSTVKHKASFLSRLFSLSADKSSTVVNNKLCSATVIYNRHLLDNMSNNQDEQQTKSTSTPVKQDTQRQWSSTIGRPHAIAHGLRDSYVVPKVDKRCSMGDNSSDLNGNSIVDYSTFSQIINKKSANNKQATASNSSSSSSSSSGYESMQRDSNDSDNGTSSVILKNNQKPKIGMLH